MAYIEREEEFRTYMKTPKPLCPGAQSDYVSRLRYLADNGINIDKNLPDNDFIKNRLEQTRAQRKKYQSKEGINSLCSAANKYRNFLPS
jgi:hypothetical protein